MFPAIRNIRQNGDVKMIHFVINIMMLFISPNSNSVILFSESPIAAKAIPTTTAAKIKPKILDFDVLFTSIFHV